MEMSAVPIPIVEIPIEKELRLFVKREDLTDPEISGNKYWKMFYNVKNYLSQPVENPMLITFGGAYSNHIAAAAAVGEKFGIRSMGVIRGNELEGEWQDNPTLSSANRKGMEFFFVSREEYRDKGKISEDLQKDYPQALIVPEGGTNELAVKGVQHMLDERTKDFAARKAAMQMRTRTWVPSKFAEEHQRVLGFKVVNDSSLEERISSLSGRKNFKLFEAHDGRYGKITDENIAFVNWFYQKYNIPLDPIYTGKMMKKLFELIEGDYFPKNSKILAFHTGGLQGILGANDLLEKQNRELINIKI